MSDHLRLVASDGARIRYGVFRDDLPVSEWDPVAREALSMLTREQRTALGLPEPDEGAS